MNIKQLGILAEEDYPQYLELAEKLLEPLFTAKDLGNDISNRKLNTWYNEQLLMNQREKGEWRVFNFIEYCWVQMIEEMRKLEVKIEVIKRLKDSLLEPVDWLTLIELPDVVDDMFKILPEEYRESAKALITNKEFLRKEGLELQVSIFFMVVIDCLVGRTYTSIMFNDKGEWCPIKEDMIERLFEIEEFKKLFNGNHISISLTNIISNYLKQYYIEDKKLKLALLSDQEEKVVKKIRQGGIKSLTIKFSDNKIDFLETTKIQKTDEASRLIDLMMLNGYQTITIKTVEGKIVQCENIIKEKIKEGTSKSGDPKRK